MEVQRYLLRHVTQSGSPALSEVCSAATPELATYCTSAITQSATTKRAEKSPRASSVTSAPKSRRMTWTVAKVAQAIIPALNALVKRLNERLPKREPTKFSVAASSTATSPP